MGEIIMKFKTTKEHRAIERDTDNIAGLSGMLENIWHWILLSADETLSQQYRDKVNRWYWNFLTNSKLQGGRLMCSRRKTGHLRQFVKLG